MTMMSSISPYWILLLQGALVVHVLVTGRNRFWILPLLLAPLIGALVYLVMEVLPGLGEGIRGQRARRHLSVLVNPGGDTRKLAAAWEQTPNADNARHYGQALLASGRHEEAGQVIDQALTGLFATEPNLLLLKARLRFEQGAAEETVSLLDLLERKNPEFRSAEGHLLLARALEQAGAKERALQEFRSVATYFPGVEARYRLAMALAASGNETESQAELEQILKDARLAPAHFRKAQAHWLRKCRAALA